ncbi:hypothetical protein F4818DRAFT_446197 [Hypoxylon cercidicola]|nr:hypothetical protein F4818DRAFT_446197 [Hypoxylon cercidicola]
MMHAKDERVRQLVTFLESNEQRVFQEKKATIEALKMYSDDDDSLEEETTDVFSFDLLAAQLDCDLRTAYKFLREVEVKSAFEKIYNIPVLRHHHNVLPVDMYEVAGLIKMLDRQNESIKALVAENPHDSVIREKEMPITPLVISTILATKVHGELWQEALQLIEYLFKLNNELEVTESMIKEARNFSVMKHLLKRAPNMKVTPEMLSAAAGVEDLWRNSDYSNRNRVLLLLAHDEAVTVPQNVDNSFPSRELDTETLNYMTVLLERAPHLRLSSEFLYTLINFPAYKEEQARMKKEHLKLFLRHKKLVEFTKDNPLGSRGKERSRPGTGPLIATSWADGDKLEWTDFSPPLQTRKNILKTIAEATLDLLKIQEPGGSAAEWIRNKIYRTRIRRSIQGNLPGVAVNDCEALLRRISDFHLPAFDDGPHVLVHGDLHPSNIIINEQQVECIVDLGIATMVPLQFSAVYPRFLTNEPRLVGDKFDWSQCAYSQTQEDDRSFYLQCIIDMAPAKGEHARVYSEILARADQEERYWWLSAVNRLDIMRALKTRSQYYI